MINSVVLVGRLVKKPELKYTPNNVAVAAFTLAVNRNFKNQSGEREADFINCQIWRKSAENLADWGDKGLLVGIEGRLQVRSYDDEQGQRKWITEVVAQSFQLLESREQRERGQQQSQPQNDNSGNNFQNGNSSGSNFQNGNSSGSNFQNDGGYYEISDSDLPF